MPNWKPWQRYTARSVVWFPVRRLLVSPALLTLPAPVHETVKTMPLVKTDGRVNRRVYRKEQADTQPDTAPESRRRRNPYVERVNVPDTRRNRATGGTGVQGGVWNRDNTNHPESVALSRARKVTAQRNEKAGPGDQDSITGTKTPKRARATQERDNSGRFKSKNKQEELARKKRNSSRTVKTMNVSAGSSLAWPRWWVPIAGAAGWQ